MTDRNRAEPPEFEEGRYLYCVVGLGDDSVAIGEDSFETAGVEDGSFEATGVEDEPVSLVTVEDVGAVVHECGGVYDSADLTEIRRWLVRHQSVIDDAADRFGTPLPFQFDTIVRGDDDVLKRWLREEYDTLTRTLETLAGHWEYRIEVVRTDPIDADRLERRDEELSELRSEIESAGEGTAFLLEKRYDRRVEGLRDRRREEFTSELVDRLESHSREVHQLERSPSASLDASGDTGNGEETVCRLTILAHEDREDAVGSVLDDVAAEPGLEVRFTGPWPPYTFVPDLGGEPESERTGRDSERAPRDHVGGEG